MSLEKANKIHGSLLKVVSRFISPSFRNYFITKTKHDYDILKGCDTSDPKVIENYITKQKELLQSLKRTVNLYNLYGDKNSNL